MKHLTIYLAVALLTFGLGISVWFVNPFYSVTPRHTEPLVIHVTLSKEHMNESFPNPKCHVYEISVENVSDKTIQGYALIYEDPYGRGYLAPCSSCKDQILRPGETKTRTIGGYNEEMRVWLDEVRFAGD